MWPRSPKFKSSFEASNLQGKICQNLRIYLTFTSLSTTRLFLFQLQAFDYSEFPNKLLLFISRKSFPIPCLLRPSLKLTTIYIFSKESCTLRRLPRHNLDIILKFDHFLTDFFSKNGFNESKLFQQLDSQNQVYWKGF